MLSRLRGMSPARCVTQSAPPTSVRNCGRRRRRRRKSSRWPASATTSSTSIKQSKEFAYRAPTEVSRSSPSSSISPTSTRSASTWLRTSSSPVHYWDQNDQSRAFATRFSAERKAMPTKNQAAVYASVLHYLKAVKQAGTDEAVAAGKAMRAMPVAFHGKPASVRADGRVLLISTLIASRRKRNRRLRRTITATYERSRRRMLSCRFRRRAPG